MAEQAHYRLKTAINQALILQGYRELPDVAIYQTFVQEVVAKCNQRSQAKLAEERDYLQPVPPTNNSSEQALRLITIFRKVTNGFRSDWAEICLEQCARW